MRAFILRLGRDDRAGPAAEFALVLPLLLIFLIGMLDVGRLMWTWNRAEKATQMGVRYAVATDMVPTGLSTYSFASSGGIPQGDPIPLSSFGGVTCTSTSGGTASCSCNTGACGASPLISDQNKANTSFANIVNRMHMFMPEITANKVQVDYDCACDATHPNLGYAGDPNGSDVAPLVRVSIRSNTLPFQPLTLILFNQSFNLPSFSAALTLEDGTCDGGPCVSN